MAWGFCTRTATVTIFTSCTVICLGRCGTPAGIAIRAPCVRLLLAAHLVGTPLYLQESARNQPVTGCDPLMLACLLPASAFTPSLTGVLYTNDGGAPLQAQ